MSLPSGDQSANVICVSSCRGSPAANGTVASVPTRARLSLCRWVSKVSARSVVGAIASRSADGVAEGLRLRALDAPAEDLARPAVPLSAVHDRVSVGCEARRTHPAAPVGHALEGERGSGGVLLAAAHVPGESARAGDDRDQDRRGQRPPADPGNRRRLCGSTLRLLHPPELVGEVVRGIAAQVRVLGQAPAHQAVERPAASPAAGR